ncbi:MAG TPA: MucR family transcriptional regulator, partial [Steroidobacteraceae bacterium]|nr:MucR family transcriptional regulator [Steroidobacteraceae bacterium]
YGAREASHQAYISVRAGLEMLDDTEPHQDSSVEQDKHIALAADVVSAYVSNNSVSVSELPGLIASVHATLTGMSNGPVSTEPEVEKPTPSQIRKSIMPDALISFIDGKPYQTLKRHLAGHGFDPYSYRDRYGLPRNYPMVAANYAAQRSALAKSFGLGQIGSQQADASKALTRRKTA